MPVHAIIPPTDVIAGGVVIVDQTFTVNHNQLSGNPQAKVARLRERLQEFALDARTEVSTHGVDDDFRDEYIHDDHPLFGTHGFNTYDDAFQRPDDSWIDDRRFYWQQNPSRLWFIERNIVVDIVLVIENDPTLGGNDRYRQVYTRTKL